MAETPHGLSIEIPAPQVPWIPFVIHPQTGSLCDVLRRDFGLAVDPWPLDGFPHQRDGDIERIWPAPRLVGARLVDCQRCGKAGIQPRTWDDALRYIPGATLGPRGEIVIELTASIQYPDGRGGDEEAAGG